MAEIKTKATKSSVIDFLNSIADESVRKDCKALASLMQDAAKAKPKMWGANIIGFGASKLKYADGSERDWMRLAFSPRKQNIALYLPVFAGRKQLEAKLGKYKSSRACVQIKRLSDIHLPAL